MNKPKQSVGSELVDRLRRFTDKLDEAGVSTELSDIVTVRKLKLDLRPRAYSANEIKLIREQLRISQAVFAEFLGVSKSAVQDWEQGRNAVSGPVCRILEEIALDIDNWAKKIRKLSETTIPA